VQEVTVTSSTLVKDPASNSEMTSSMVMSRRLAEVSSVGLKDFWAASPGKATPLSIQTEQQASGSHFLSIIEANRIGLFGSKATSVEDIEAEDVGKPKTTRTQKNASRFGKVARYSPHAQLRPQLSGRYGGARNSCILL
jgi:hypothetical protein